MGPPGGRGTGGATRGERDRWGHQGGEGLVGPPGGERDRWGHQGGRGTGGATRGERDRWGHQGGEGPVGPSGGRGTGGATRGERDRWGHQGGEGTAAYPPPTHRVDAGRPKVGDKRLLVLADDRQVLAHVFPHPPAAAGIPGRARRRTIIIIITDNLIKNDPVSRPIGLSTPADQSACASHGRHYIDS